MRKLCVFYNKPSSRLGTTSDRIEWIICKACRKTCNANGRIPMVKRIAQELSKR
jgi:hypothetical protein